MTVFGTFVVFVIVWWCVFFMALPVGVRPVDEPPPEHFLGAPDRQRLWTKAAATTAIAVAITALVWVTVDRDWLDFNAYLEAEDTL